MNNEKIKDIEALFISKGLNPVVGTIYQQQEKWENWYRGDVQEFHYFSIKTINGTTTQRKKPSLQMAKRSCEDWAGLLWNENSEISFPSDKANEILHKVLKDNNFQTELVNHIELSFSYGTGVTVEYIADGKTKIAFIKGKYIMPIEYENTTIKGIAILQEIKEEKHTYTHIQYHTYDDGVYRIEHEVYQSDKAERLGDKTNIDIVFNDDEIREMEHIEDDEVIYYIEYETDEPHFQVLKPNIVNNFDIGSPMGIAAFANAISVLQGIDNKYYSLENEGDLKRTRIFVNGEATVTQRVKEVVGTETVQRQLRYFDVDETVFQSMVLPEEKPIEIFDPEYRASEHILGIKFDLSLFGNKTGLGNDYYSYDSVKGVTATEVIHKNSDTWRNRRKHIKILKHVLIGMARAILYLERELGNYNGEIEEPTIVFDDSIIIDDEKRLEDMKQDSLSGFLPKWRYVMLKYKLTEEEAKQWVKESDEEQDNAFFGTINGLENENED